MRKIFFGLSIWLLLGLQLGFASSWPKEITDISGHKVVLDKPPSRIILASGYSFLALAFVDPKPTEKLIAWGSELKKFDEATYALFLTKFPELAQLQTIGSGSGSELSAELILSLQPDLVVFDLWQAKGSTVLLQQLQDAGINVVYIDYYTSPVKNTVASTRLLGQIMDREEEAEKLIEFYQLHMDKLTSRLKTQPLKRPKVLMQAYPGVWSCCWSSGSGGIGEYISLFNGDNIGASLFPNANGGNLNLEYILVQDPDIYIATGHSGVDANNGLPIGTNVSAALAARQLQVVVSAPGLKVLKAVTEKRAYGLWNYFSGSPFNIVAAEVMAKWLQPELYADIDPEKTMQEMNQLFLPVPLQGTYWLAMPQ